MKLWLWADSDARPLPEYGYATMLDAIHAIEAEAVGEAGLRASAQQYVDALDAARKPGLTLDQWSDLDAKARVALRDLRLALKAKRRG